MGHDHPETISPTAHYTGYVWFAHGQSHEAFATRAGRLMYHALRGPNAAARAVGLSVPLVVRLEGTNVEKGKQLLKESGLTLITADDLADAAEKAVKAAREKK